MNRRSFLLGSLVAPLAVALGIKATKSGEPSAGEAFEWGYWHGKTATVEVPDYLCDTKPVNVLLTKHSELLAIRRSTITLKPVKWYNPGDVVTIEGRLYEVVTCETRREKFGLSDVYVGDAYLRELNQDFAPKADLRYAINREQTTRYSYPFREHV